MGVRGLSSWTRANCTPRRIDFALASRTAKQAPVLIFDAIGLAFYLYKDLKLPWLFGGDYLDFKRGIARYFTILTSSGVKCVVCFDGATSDAKRNCSAKRRDADLNRIGAIKRRLWTMGNQSDMTLADALQQVEQGCVSSIVSPLFLVACLKDVLMEHFSNVVDVYQAEYEADSLIVKLAIRYAEESCEERLVTVVTNDSDFLVFPDVTNVVLFWHLLVDQNEHGAVVIGRSHSCQQVSSVLKIPSWTISIIASICGHDSSDPGEVGLVQQLVRKCGIASKQIPSSQSKDVPATCWIDGSATLIRHCIQVAEKPDDIQSVLDLLSKKLLQGKLMTNTNCARSKKRNKRNSKQSKNTTENRTTKLFEPHIIVPELFRKSCEEYIHHTSNSIINLSPIRSQSIDQQLAHLINHREYTWPRPFFEHVCSPLGVSATFDSKISKPIALRKVLAPLLHQVYTFAQSNLINQSKPTGTCEIKEYGVKDNLVSWSCTVISHNKLKQCEVQQVSDQIAEERPGVRMLLCSLQLALPDLCIDYKQLDAIASMDHYTQCAISEHRQITVLVVLQCVITIASKFGATKEAIRQLVIGIYCSLFQCYRSNLQSCNSVVYASCSMANSMMFSGLFQAVMYLLNQLIQLVSLQEDECLPLLSSACVHGTTFAESFHSDPCEAAQRISDPVLDKWLTLVD